MRYHGSVGAVAHVEGALAVAGVALEGEDVRGDGGGEEVRAEATLRVGEQIQHQIPVRRRQVGEVHRRPPVAPAAAVLRSGGSGGRPEGELRRLRHPSKGTRTGRGRRGGGGGGSPELDGNGEVWAADAGHHLYTFDEMTNREIA